MVKKTFDETAIVVRQKSFYEVIAYMRSLTQSWAVSICFIL